MISGWGWGEGSHTWTRTYIVRSSHQHQRRECPGFRIALPRCAVEEEREVVSLEAISSNTSRIELDSLLHLPLMSGD